MTLVTDAAGSRDAMVAVLQRAGAQVILRDWLSANQIVFADRDRGATVVDTGHVTRSAQTLALVRHALADLPLAQILNTHLHSDHCGGNAALREYWPAARIVVPCGYREHLEVADEEGSNHLAMGQLCGQFHPDQYLQPASSIELGALPWECHATPGHDPDAMVFYQPDTRILISGDALWEERLAIIFPALTDVRGFDAAHVALDTIERLAPAIVIPGHGEPFTDIAGALRASRQRLDAFAASPERHRRYALRVMVTYHLLERQDVEREALLQWITATPIVALAMGCTPASHPTPEQAASLLDSMLSAGILTAHHTRIRVATG